MSNNKTVNSVAVLVSLSDGTTRQVMTNAIENKLILSLLNDMHDGVLKVSS